ncbi:MAG TPA: histidine phosphatase family protein, partial [Halomonas sp.]|nr:histidine phosphatase family protein [Halomonas sp.]
MAKHSVIESDSMRHLYLMRHSKAKKSTSGMADHQRPLSKRGKRQAAAMARVLQRWQALEGDIYVSSAVRTRETLEEVTGQLPDLALADQARFEQTLYTFDGEALLAWLKTLPNEAGRVLVIGHNPALLDLAHWFCRETPSTLPTGSMLYFTLPETPWSALEQRCAKLMVSFTPEQASHALFQRRAPTPPKPCEDDTASLIRGLLEHQSLMFRS